MVATILYLLDLGFVEVLITVVVSVGSAWASYWKSDAIALKMSRAVEADRHTYARLHNLVEGLCIASGLPKPRIYIIDDVAPNTPSPPATTQTRPSPSPPGSFEKMNRVELGRPRPRAQPHQERRHPGVDPRGHHGGAHHARRRHQHPDDVVERLERRGHNDQEGGAAPFLAIFGLALLLLSPLLARLMQLRAAGASRSPTSRPVE
ncbi:MAG: hypothetical protein R2711_10005 [Acidimicrobiales bacterium]